MFEYHIEEAGDADRLAELVRLRLQDRWILQGGIAMVRYDVTDRDGYTVARYWFAQAMTRYTDAE